MSLAFNSRRGLESVYTGRLGKRAQSKSALAIKRPFILNELRAVLDVADLEWKSMILFGLYTGQRLADIATLRWNKIRIQHRRNLKKFVHFRAIRLGTRRLQDASVEFT